MTADKFNSERRSGSARVLSSVGGRIVTSFSNTEDLSEVGIECWALTTGTLKVTGFDGQEVEFTSDDLVALGGHVPFAVKRIWDDGTTVTRVLIAV